MEIYNASGKLKTPENLQVTKPIGALFIKSDLPLTGLTNETISIDVERVDGNNESIAINIPLLDFILSTTHGNTFVDTTDGFSAMCEIAGFGSVELEENASIRIALSNLKSANNYEIHGIEYPIFRVEALKFDKKVINSEHTNQELFLDDADLVIVQGSEAITSAQVKYDNGEIVKRSLLELQALQHDLDPVIGQGTGENGELILPSTFPDILIINTVGVDSIDFEKTTAKGLKLTLMNAFDLVDVDGDGEYDNV